MALWLNHVAMTLPRNGTSTHAVDPSDAAGDGNTVVAGTEFTPTAGRFQVIIIEGAVTSTTPTGWTLQASAINYSGLYAWSRTAAGSDTISTTHNASNYPVAVHWFEFEAGSSWIDDISSTNVSQSEAQANPNLTGLSSAAKLLVGVRAVADANGASALSFTWSTITEILDVNVDTGATDGFLLAIGYVEDSTATSFAPVGTMAGDPSVPTCESITIAIDVAADAGLEVEPDGATVTVTPGTLTVVEDQQVAPSGATVTVTPGGLTVTSGITVSPEGATVTVTPGTLSVFEDQQVAPDGATVTVTPGTLEVSALVFGDSIEDENALDGDTLAAISGSGDANNQGFTREMSVDAGESLDFAVDGDCEQIDIYRLGHYGGDGARLVGTITNTPTSQGNESTIADSNGATECSGWSTTATWNVPSTALSGFYIAVIRNEALNNGSYAPFVVRNDSRTADIVVGIPTSTWGLAYNAYGGPSVGVTAGKTLYGSGAGNFSIGNRSFAVSADRPIISRADIQNHWDDYDWGMIDYLEENGFDVKYVASHDLDRDASSFNDANTYISVGHDEYWSQGMRDNVEAFRDAGGNVIFATANEVFWRVRWADSYRTMWCYKDTMPFSGHTAGDPLDPVSWTGTWRDTRWGSREPENLLTGMTFRMNGLRWENAVILTATYSAHPFWRDTSVESTNLTLTNALGFEANSVDLPSSYPSSVMGATSINIDGWYADDNGENYTGNGTLEWAIPVYRLTPAAGVVVSFGSNAISNLLSSRHASDSTYPSESAAVRQAFANLFYDFGLTAATLDGTLATPTPVTSFDAAYDIPTFVSPDGPTVTVTPGTVSIDQGAASQAIEPTGATVTVTPGTLGITTGAVDVEPEGPTVSVTPGTLSVTAGATAIEPTGATVTVTPGTLGITTGAVDVEPEGATVTVTPGTLSVTPGATAIEPDGATVTVTPGTLTATQGITVVADGPTVTVTPGTVEMTTGAVDVEPDGATVTVTPGTLSVATGVTLTGATVTVTPGTVTLEAQSGIALEGATVTVSPGSVSVLDDGFTPSPERTYTVAAETRTYTVAAETRTVEVTAP